MLKDKYSFEPQLVEYGPGLCVEYFEDDWQEKEKQSLDEAADVLREFAEEYPLGIEMGRFLAASCGKYYTQVKDLKSTGDANYAILDGGIHHLNYFGQRMAMYNYSFEKLGLDYAYVAFDIKEDKVKDAIAAMKTFNMRGCNVTMPDKVEAAKYMDELSPAAILSEP